MSQETPVPDRPWRFAAGTTALAVAALGATGWWLSAAPGSALVGRTGIHDDDRVAANVVCLDCHVPFVGTPASRCLAPGCHGELATGTPPRAGPAMPVRFHAALRDVQCGLCHLEHRSPGPPGPFDHRRIPDALRRDCQRCHPVDDRPNHPRSDRITCGRCHGLTSWRDADANHAPLDAEPCELCHRPPETRPHAALAGTCDGCHGVERWSPIRAQDAAK